MSKILTKKEAEQIVKMMLEPSGFNACILEYLQTGPISDQYRLCNSILVKKKVGFLWWKKTIEVTVLDPVFTGWCWEDAIEKLDKWIQNKVIQRVVLADKFRDKFALQEADETLDKVLRDK